MSEFYRNYLAVAVFIGAALLMVGAMLGVGRLLRHAQIDVIAGGPPCQPFSKAGRFGMRHLVREGRRDPHDKRRDLWRSYLEIVGLAPLTGFVSASANTRELAPLIAALALASQVGCRFTAQLGSMKIHEEVDALEVMAVEPMRYLVSTRVIACGVAIVPLYLVGLIGSYIASMLSVVVIFGQSPGQYDHYFSTFIQGGDVFKSVIKILVFATAITLIHCWYGMRVGGGPQAVGEATGRAIRASIASTTG